MVSPTVPYGLPLFDDTIIITPWQAPYNAISNGLNSALGLIVPVVADLAALKALTGMPNGANAYVTEGGANFSYNLAATRWVQQGVATFASLAARDSAYAKAAGAYKVIGAQVLRSDKQRVETYFTTAAGGKTTAGWYQTGGNPEVPAALTPAAGMTIVGQSLSKQAGIVTLLLRVNGTVFSGTLLSMLPLGYRPAASLISSAGIITGSTPVASASQITTAGEVYAYANPSNSYTVGISVSFPAVDTPVAD